jgi:hypothetical protein
MASAVVDLPHPDSPTRPKDSCRPIRERDVAQRQAVVAAHAVGDVEVADLEVADGSVEGRT